MVGSTGTLMTMRLVRSKIRKREESAVNSPVNVESPLPHHHNHFHYSHQHHNHQIRDANGNNTQQTNGNVVSNPTDPIAYMQKPSSVWVFPPLPPQPNIYCASNQIALLQANDKNGLKGFKRQLSGRFKRLITRKPNEPAPVIPPELKPQLKTIYVY